MEDYRSNGRLLFERRIIIRMEDYCLNGGLSFEWKIIEDYRSTGKQNNKTKDKHIHLLKFQ
jgi:hypothetical protein